MRGWIHGLFPQVLLAEGHFLGKMNRNKYFSSTFPNGHVTAQTPFQHCLYSLEHVGVCLGAVQAWPPLMMDVHVFYLCVVSKVNIDVAEWRYFRIPSPK